MTDGVDALVNAIAFNSDGLVPAIAQDHASGEVLMMAWMNEQVVRETLETGQVVYWSRSRGKPWRKGESSGQVQTLKDMRLDCDGDTLLLEVAQKGVACHTGRRSCFHYALRDGALTAILPVEESPETLYGK